MLQGCEEYKSTHSTRWNRAREFHLYDDTGYRYIDFWQEGGRALLGYKPKGVSQGMKNMLSKGIWSVTPHYLIARLEKKISLLLETYYLHTVVYTYADVCQYISSHIHSKKNEELDNQWDFWRPYTDIPDNVSYIVPILPFPWTPYPYCICGKDKTADMIEISSVITVALIRITDLLLNSKTVSKRPHLALASMWERNSIYLYYQGNCYQDDYERFSQMGILLPPHEKCPAIIPAVLSEYEKKLWFKAVNMCNH